MKQKICALIMTIIMLIPIFCFGGCSFLRSYTIEPWPEFDSEFFRCALGLNSNGKKVVYLVGFTELGLEQSELVLPQEINDIPVADFGYGKGYLRYKHYGSFESEKLKKLYIPFTLKGWDMFGESNLPNCYNVKICNLSFFYAGEAGNIFSYKLYNELLNNTETTHTLIVKGEGRQILANVSYMYNYDDAENEGYYWADSYDNDIITFIPPEPTRANYTFVGWYKEPECINIWNFETDKTGDELVIDVETLPSSYNKFSPNFPPQYDENSGIRLYAKWNKN
jgi:uncharacterized repeat protein (TIGR02543 family)